MAISTNKGGLDLSGFDEAVKSEKKIDLSGFDDAVSKKKEESVAEPTGAVSPSGSVPTQPISGSKPSQGKGFEGMPGGYVWAGGAATPVPTPIPTPKKKKEIYQEDSDNVLMNAIKRGLNQADLAAQMTATGGDPTMKMNEEIARIQKENRQLKSSEAFQKFNNATTTGEAWAALTESPSSFATILAELSLESLTAQAKHGLIRAGAGAATGAAVGSVIPGAGTAAGAGVGILTGLGLASLNLEYSGKMLEVFEEMGFDTTNPFELEKAFSDEKKVDEARSAALKKGIPVAVFDMISGGLAGRITTKPAKSLLGKVATETIELGTQAGLGMAGEATGQIVAGEKINPAAILAEGIGELGPGTAEIIGGRVYRKIAQPKNPKEAVSTIVATAAPNADKGALVKDQIDIALMSGEIDGIQADEYAKEAIKALEADKTVPVQVEGIKRVDVLPIIIDKSEVQNEILQLEKQKETTDAAFHPMIDTEISTRKTRVDELTKQIQSILTAPSEVAPTVEVDKIRVQILDDIFKDSTAQNNADALEQRMINAEEISMTEINDVLDGLYKQVEMVMDNYFDNEAGKQYVQALLDKIDKIKSYEFATNKEVAFVTERKAVQTARNTVQEAASVINLARAPRRTATITSEDGTTGTYSIEVGPDGAVTFEQPNAEPIRVGNVNDVNKTARIVETVLNEKGLPQSVSFSITDEQGKSHIITVEAKANLKPQQLLDLAINIRANELGTVNPADFDTAYEEVSREITITKPKTDAIQVETAGQVPVQPEAIRGETDQKGQPQAKPQEAAQKGEGKVKPGVQKQTLESVLEKVKRANLDKATERVISSLKESGIDVRIIEDEAEYDAIIGVGGTNGLFDDQNGVVYVNPSRMKLAQQGNRVLFHESTHPVLNILYNTDRPTYDRIMSGMMDAAKKGIPMWEDLQNFRQRYIDAGFSEVQADNELMTETFGRIINGEIGLNDIPVGWRQAIVDMLNKVAKLLRLKPIGAVTDAGKFRDFAASLKDAFEKGRSISTIVGAENVKKFQSPFVDINGEQISEEKLQFSLMNDFSNITTGMTFEYLSNNSEFDKIKTDGFITENMVLDDFTDAYVVLHSPDAAFSGTIKKNGNVLVDGKGGIFYPIRFHKDGFMWASTKGGATTLANVLNKSAKLNNGRVLMALVSAPRTKLLSSTTMSNAIVDFFTSKIVDNKINIKQSYIINALKKSAKSTIVNNKGEKIGLNISLSGITDLNEVVSKIKTKLSPDNSTFADRKQFVFALLDDISSRIKGTESEQLLGRFLSEEMSFAEYKQQGKKVYNLSRSNLAEALSNMLQEPMLRNEKDSGNIYAIIEIDATKGYKSGSNVVKVMDSKKHESYPKTIVPIDKKNKVRLHILQDRLQWNQVSEDPTTNQIIKSNRELKVFPTSGVSVSPVRIKGQPSLVEKGNIIVYHAGTLDSEGNIYLTPRIKEANEYASMNESKVLKFQISTEDMAPENIVRDTIKQLRLTIPKDYNLDELLLHEVLDTRFESSLSKNNINKLYEYLKQKGYSGISFIDEDILQKRKEGVTNYLVFDKNYLTEKGKPISGQPSLVEGGRFTATIDGVNVELKSVDVDVVNGFYSTLEQEVFGSRQDRLPAKKWLDRFKNREEAKWTGLNDWLESQQGAVSKQDILDYMKENRIVVSEVVLGKDDYRNLPEYKEADAKSLEAAEKILKAQEKYWNTKSDTDFEAIQEAKNQLEKWTNVKQLIERRREKKGVTKYSQYQLEGEKENYREVLVTLPSAEKKSSRELLGGNPKIYTDSKKAEADYGEQLNPGEELIVYPSGVWIMKLNDDRYWVQVGRNDETFDSIEEAENWLVKEAIKTDLTEDIKTIDFMSPHFDEPNILVHLRMNERTDAEGNKVLFIEEVQSDWGQKGRREGFAQKEQKPKKLEELSREQLIEILAWNDPNGIYTDEDSRREGYEPMTKEEALDKVNELIQSEGDAFETERFLRQGSMVEGIPTAPFVMNTSDWVKLAMRVALKEAVKSGANSIAWTTGEQQNDRFDLSKTIDELFYQQLSDGKGNLIDSYYIRGTKNQTRLIEKDNLRASELEQYVGKEVAEKIINGDVEGTLKGIDLKVGGKGMIGFYGTVTNPGIIGQVASKLFGQEVGVVNITTLPKVPEGVTVADIYEAGGMEEYKKKLEYQSPQPSVTVTPQMKAEVKRGLPQFSLMEVEKPNQPTLKAAGLTPADVEQWKKKNKVSQREGRVTGVQKSAQDLYEGKITIYQHIANVRKEQPTRTYQAVPQLPSYKDVASSLAENQMETGVVGLNKGIAKGTQVGARLDIPSFNNYGTNVVSIHEAIGSGKAIGYGRTASLYNVKFKTSPSAALKVAMGESKGTWARMIGSWNNESDQSVVDRAKQAISNGEWIQIGINPFRHSWFYNRATGMPVMEASEVLQVGNMVLARGARELDLNNAKDKAEFEDTFKVKLKSGKMGQFSLMEEGEVAKRLERVSVTVLENIEKPISESKFENKYVAQHKDLVGKREGNLDKNKENILKNGFKEGINVNALPIYTGYEGNVIDQRYGNRKGDIIYILPKEGVTEGPNGYKTKEGYKPNLSDVFAIEYDKQPTYEAYRNNLKNPSYIASAYIQAKQDGSNPELVKAVEDAIGEPTTTVSKAQKAGIRPTTREDVEAALSRGDRVIATLEMDDEPIEITSMAMVDRIDLDTTVIIPDVKGKMKKAFPSGQMSIFAPRGMMNTDEVAKKQYPLHQALVQIGVDAYQNQGINNYASFVTYAKKFDESINKNPYMERVWEDVTRIVKGNKPLIQSEKDYRDFLVKQNNVPLANAERLKKRNRTNMVIKAKEKMFDSRAEFFKALSQSPNKLWSIAANYVNVIGGMGAKAIYTADMLADGVFKGLKTEKEYLIGNQMQSEYEIFNNLLIRIRVQEIQRKMQDKFNEFIKIQSGITEIESANKDIKRIEKELNGLQKKYVKLQNTNTPEAKKMLDEIGVLEDELNTIKDIIKEQHGDLTLDEDGLYVIPSEYTDSRDNIKRYLDRNDMLVKDVSGNYSLGTYKFANNLNERTAFNEIKQLIEQHPELYEKLKQRADAYHLAFNTLLNMQLKAELISQESYDDMVEYKYVPMRYIGYMIEEIVAGDDIRINPEQSKLIKRLKGGSEDDIDMAFDEALKFQTYMVTRAIAKNTAMQKVYEAAKADNFQGPFYQPDVTGVDADGNFEYGNLPPGDAIIYFYIDGKKMALATSKEIASAFNGSNVRDLGMLDEAIGYALFTIPFKAVTTNLNPGFGLAQIVLDVPQALLTNEAYSNITTGLPRILFRDLKLLTGKAIGPLSRKLGINAGFDKEWNDLYLEALEYGGLITFTGMDSETMSILQAAEKSKGRKPNMLTNAFYAYKDNIEKFGTIMETVTRLAVYRKMRNSLISEYKKSNKGKDPKGEDLDNIRTQAAAASLNVLNYNRGGTLVKPLNRALAYLNVAFQVPYSVAQYAKRNPWEFSLKAMEIAVWPVAITILGFLSIDDEDKEKFLEIYNNYNEYEKANYWHILNPLWNGEDLEDMIIRIKKPTVLLPLLNSTEVGAMHSITGGKTMSPKEYATERLASDVLAMQPLGEQMISSVPILNAYYKYSWNKDPYRKTEIVKNEKEIFDFREGQTDPNVGKFYKYIADKTGYFDENTGEYFESISPARMDAAVKSAVGNYDANITTALPLLVTDYALSKISSDYANFKDPAQTDDVKSFMEKAWEGVGLKKRFFAKVPEVNPRIYEEMTDDKKIKNFLREDLRADVDAIINEKKGLDETLTMISDYYIYVKKTNPYYNPNDLTSDLENAYKYVENKNWLKDKPLWYRTFIFAPDVESKIKVFDISTENMSKEEKSKVLAEFYTKGFITKANEPEWVQYLQKEL